MLFHRRPKPTPNTLEAILAAYETRLLAYVARITGNASAAEDIVQDTFIKLAADWVGEFVDGPAMSSWLHKVAHSKAVDWVRREVRLAKLHEEHQNERGEYELPHPEHGGESRVSPEIVLKLEEALLKLQDKEREVVLLKIYEELSYKEISKQTGLSESNVGFILHTAMKKLAQSLGGNKNG